MIQTKRNGGGFFLNLRDAAYIPSNVMKHVEANVARAVKMMPAQDVMDLAINGAHLVRDMDDNRDLALMEAEKSLESAQATINALKAERQASKVERDSDAEPLVT